MSKRLKYSTENSLSCLIVDKSSFADVLLKRINLGEELYGRIVVTADEILKLERDYEQYDKFNIDFLKNSFNIDYNEYRSKYEESGRFSGIFDANLGRLKIVKNKINLKLVYLKNLYSLIDILETPVLEVLPTETYKIKDNLNISSMDKTKVFIVHGHDEKVKTEVARFVENLGIEAIILHEQASSSATIIEKIEKYSDVGFGIVLYTPCDVGAKKGNENHLRNRARQNVVFEHGFLIGKLGRARVCAMVKNDVETPNDISGVVYVNIDEAGAWKMSLSKELKNSGYTINTEALLK